MNPLQQPEQIWFWPRCLSMVLDRQPLHSAGGYWPEIISAYSRHPLVIYSARCLPTMAARVVFRMWRQQAVLGDYKQGKQLSSDYWMALK